MGFSDTLSYTDSTVSPGVDYYYTVGPVNTDGREGARVQGAFAYAASYYTLPTYLSSQTTNLASSSKDYYRLSVSKGDNITITWQDGNNQHASGALYVSAWQNDGTEIFKNVNWGGYTAPRAFSVTEAGYLTVEVQNGSDSTSYNYQIYYSY
jgi:hypothetical protein